jgi:broad specificity phosphatase PhoE
MELICVRHGRTSWNALRRFQGQTDIPLDHEGLAQAQALAVHLRAEHFDLAISSDLTRARTTAEAIVAGRDIELELSPALREMHFGQWEGLAWPQIVERWPELDVATEKAPMHYTPQGGESWDDLCARVDGALRALTTRLPQSGRALVVSHAGVMHAAVRSLTSAGVVGESVPTGVRFVPAGIIRVRGSYAGGWEFTAVNETAAAPTR